MLKKYNSYLLEHYPLLWNMRLLGVLGISLAFHLLHFVIGYFDFIPTDSIGGWQEPQNIFFATPFAIFSIIGSIIIFILWLIRVFRNNAFKSFYPVSSRQLFVQFSIFMLVSLLNITYYYSYATGYVFHARNMTSKEANQKDIEIYNKVIGLLQESAQSYSIENRLYPAPFPLVKQFVNANEDNNNSQEYYYEGKYGERFSKQQVDSMTGAVDFSYLNHYNYYAYINPLGETENYYGADIESVPKLKERYKAYLHMLEHSDELKKSMEDFIGLCQRHNIKHKIDVAVWHSWVYHPPFFPVKYVIKQYYDYQSSITPATELSETAQFNPDGFYVELNKLQYLLRNTMRAYEYGFELSVFCGFLYVALALALIIFAYRSTSRKVWLISYIGSGVVLMFVGALTALVSYGASSNRQAVLGSYLIIILGFLLAHFMVKNKTASGVLLNWFAWSLPAVSLIIFGLIQSSKLDHNNTSSETTKPLYIEQHADVYFFACLIVYFVALGFFINPLFRRWQALPED
jgi:hypothetical protein